uniref:Uncharacterized protein n=1 Tax=Sphaerodactylus townsendi TaxID=933632 RepID=A0ACB8FER4_9SAUR
MLAPKQWLDPFSIPTCHLDREGSSMEVQVDIESKPMKFRTQLGHGSSSVEDAGTMCHEVENDRLEKLPHQSGNPLTPGSAILTQRFHCAELVTLLKNVLITDFQQMQTWVPVKHWKETNNNHSQQHAVELNTAIQTEI